MDFFKKIFGGKKEDDSGEATGAETFQCEDCGQERPVAQKKSVPHDAEKSRNVCEFC